VQLFRSRATRGGFEETLQKTSGRLYLSSQFRAVHLRVNYDLFGNRLVDAYLDGELGAHQPKLIRSGDVS
jgi:hypothetical protein